MTVTKHTDQTDVVLAVMTTVTLVAISVFFILVISPDSADFQAYWAAGRLALTGGDPYDYASVAQLQGRPLDNPIPLNNPPWTLPLFMLFGALPYTASLILWVLVMCMILVASVYWLQLKYAPDMPPWLGWALTMASFPVLQVLGFAQVTPLVLLGLVLFLAWEKDRPARAGLALNLMLLKPHLLYLVLLVLVLEFFRRQDTDIIDLALGWLLGFMTLTLVVAIVSPAAGAGYLAAPSPGRLCTWSVASQIRCMVTQSTQAWQSLVLVPWGVAVALWYYRRHRHWWSWTAHGPVLVLLSMATTPFHWSFDLILVFWPLLWLYGRFKYANLSERAKNVRLVIGGWALLHLPVMMGYYTFAVLKWYWWWLPWIVALWLYFGLLLYRAETGQHMAVLRLKRSAPVGEGRK